MASETETKSKGDLNSLLICPVCGEHDASVWREAFDDRYGHPDLFKIVRCQDCSHLMTVPMPSEDDLADLYGTFYPRKNITTNQIITQADKAGLAFSKIRRWWMGEDNHGQYYSSPGEKMLDVGCGSGLSLLEARKLGVDAWGIEADPNVKKFADELGLRIHQGSLHDNPFQEIIFDLIVLNQVIEHIPGPERAMKIIQSRLSKNGRVILVFPNVNSLWCKISGKRWINWHIPYHLHHFNKMTFSQMVERCGYKIIRTRTITPNIWTIMQIRASKQSIQRGQPNPIWKVNVTDGSSSPKTSHRNFIKQIFLSSVLVAIAIVNRIVDSFGFGDSLMVEVKLKKSL